MNREELEAESGVSARNIRYLIAEGILPPPDGPGRSARYTPEHLRHLRIYVDAKTEGISSLDVIRRRIESSGLRRTLQVLPGVELTLDPAVIADGTSIEDIMTALRAIVEENLGRK